LEADLAIFHSSHLATLQAAFNCCQRKSVQAAVAFSTRTELNVTWFGEKKLGQQHV
jgi:GTP:adenosylcobinamide-phosphate guanylyltransferase